MPPQMRMSPQYSSPRGGGIGGGIENGNRLGNRPVVRQSKIYRQNESGNAMKSLMGHDDLSWDTEKQQGVFAGQSVYDAEKHHSPPGPSGVSPHHGRAPLAAQQHDDVPEYPLPGCDATCDGCGEIVQRFYHCTECVDPDLFDLCTTCCAAVYLKQGSLKQPLPPHPTHNLASHKMVQICPPSL